MAKSMARKSKPTPKKPNDVVPLIQRRPSARGSVKFFLTTATIAVIGAGIYFFSNILETMGFGLVLAFAWLVIIVWIVWQKQVRNVAKYWNFILGAFLLTLATWGILALFQPQATIPSLTNDVDLSVSSLGGNAGKYFIGNQGVGAHPALRLAILIIAGIVVIIPSHSLVFSKRFALALRIITAAVIDFTRKNMPVIARGLAEFYRKHPLHKMKPAFASPISKRSSRQQATSTLETADNLTTSLLESDVKEEIPIADGIQLPLPPVPDTIQKPELDTAKTKPTPTIKGELPPLALLEQPSEIVFTSADNDKRARLIEESLESYGVEAKVVQINPGPSVTQFGLEPGWVRKYKQIPERDLQGKIKVDKDGNPISKNVEVSKTRVKVERITALSNNLALALATPNIRIEAPVPGKPVVGIEVPNVTSSVVRIRGVIESPSFQRIKARSTLALALGNGAAGEPVAADLAKMPHLLIAGTTGSGKTVCINSIISCLLMCNAPEDMRLMLIDPKRVELVSFNGVPHLISPVIVEVEDAINALKKVIREMETRFSKFAAVGARNIDGYNKSPLVTERMPYFVVIVDELADLMMTASEIVEPTICRLAQLARATGIHLILATQRPSVDVVTGLIKANFPTRISFAVVSIVDSRTILDFGGAEKLLGQGDMLYVPPDANKPKRLRGCFVSDQEIDKLVKFWKDRHDIYPSYLDDAIAKAFAALETEEVKSEDPLMETARRLAKEHSHISTSLLQRRLHIGYPRAARIMDMLEEEGTVVRGDVDSRETFDIDEEEEEE